MKEWMYSDGLSSTELERNMLGTFRERLGFRLTVSDRNELSRLFAGAYASLHDGDVGFFGLALYLPDDCFDRYEYAAFGPCCFPETAREFLSGVGLTDGVCIGPKQGYSLTRMLLTPVDTKNPSYTPRARVRRPYTRFRTLALVETGFELSFVSV